jgi:flagellar biosynthesis/type III secretory pathway protein FliH
MSDESYKVAVKIMALVDEFPSEPFSFERRQMEQRLTDIIALYAEALDGERDVAYELGYDEGHSEGYAEAEQDAEDRIAELETELEELREDLDDVDSKIDQAFAEGYETASKGDRVIETLEFKN